MAGSTASPQTAVSRMLRETASYYVATFDAEPSERNGQTYRVDLRTSREKVKLRSGRRRQRRSTAKPIRPATGPR